MRIAIGLLFCLLLLLISSMTLLDPQQCSPNSIRQLITGKIDFTVGDSKLLSYYALGKPIVIKYAAGLLLILLVSIGWNLRLRKEVIARKQAQALAIKERNLAQQYLDVAGVVLIALNQKGEIILINRKGCQILGYQEDELLMQNWFFLCVHEDSRIQALKSFVQMMSGELGLVGCCESLIITKTGEQRVIAFRTSVFKDGDDNMTGILSSGEDITEYKAIERHLRTLSVAVEQSPASVVITDLDANLLYVNPRFTQVTGYSHEEAIGQNPRILQSGLTPKELYNELWEVLTQGKVWHGELINRRKNGETYWEDAHIAAVKDAVGVITHYVGVKIDITERKQAEQRLQESEQKLLAILENVSAYIYLKDTEGRYLFANRPVRELWNATMDEIVGFGDDKFFDSQTVEKIRCNDNRVLVYGETICSEETNIVAETGRLATYWSVKLPLHKEDGTIYALCGISTDITEQKKVEENLRRAKEMAEQANRLKSEFLANMSHEIRTPMNAILGFSSILSDLITNPVQRHYLEAIERSGKTLLQLINDILDLSKIEAGKLSLQYQVVAIRVLLNDIEIIFSQQLADKDIDFSLSIAKEMPEYLMLDEIRLRQVLLNLIGNAVKFTKAGFIKLMVDMESLPIDCCGIDSNSPHNLINLTISISDSGMGIAKDQQEKIFLAFTQQEQQSASYGGTGLGLTICKRLVDLMQGQISVDSELGKGSCFKIRLENIAIAQQPPPSIAQTLLTKNTSIHFYPATLLLVDDIAVNRLLIKSYLAEFSELKLIEAETGEQALELVNQQQFDLILMDKRLPGENGDVICHKIKALPTYAQVGIIMITASVLPTLEKPQAPAYDLQLDKPVKKEQLLAAMHSFLKCETTQLPCENLISAPPVKANATSEQLSALVSLLEQDYKSKIASLRQSGIVDISAFVELADELILIAQEYQCDALHEWASQLKEQAELFEVVKLPKTLMQFEVLLKIKHAYQFK